MTLKKGLPADQSGPKKGHSLIIGPTDDLLATEIAREWHLSGQDYTWLPDATLASTGVSLADHELIVGSQSISSILWRVQPGTLLSGNFILEDVSFADTETRAFWLAALSLPSVRTNFRPHPSQLFSRSGWHHWRTILAEAGLALYPLEFGTDAKDVWLPHCQPYPRATPQATNTASGLGLATLRNDKIWYVNFAGSPPITADKSQQTHPYVQDAIKVLVANDLYLGTIVMADQKVLAVDATPRFTDPSQLHVLANPLLKLLNGTSNCW